MKYWVFFPELKSDGAVLSSIPSPGPEDYEYATGKSLAEVFPEQEKAVMLFDPQHPEGIKLYGIVYAVDRVLVVSNKVKGILDSLEIK